METFDFIFMRQTVREKNFDQAFCKAEMLNKSLSNNDLKGAVINHALIHTQPHPPKKKVNTHPHPAKKRSYLPTPSHTQQKKGDTPSPYTHTQPRKDHTHPHLVKKRRYLPKFSCRCKENKISHYPLGNQICQKLKKSSIPNRSIDINILRAETLAGGNFYGTDFRD